MQRAERLLLLTQALRRRRRPVTARTLAEEMEVSERTIYRDVATLQATGVTIRGEAGVGYVLDAGFDLPPLMLSIEECEALMLGARFVRERADQKLALAVENAISKIEAVLPAALRPHFADAPLYAPLYGARREDAIDPADLRRALRENRKIDIAYCDEAGRETRRIVWPMVIAYFESRRGLVAWCELRADFRHFRTDRIREMAILPERVPRRRAALIAEWEKKAAEENECHQRPEK